MNVPIGPHRRLGFVRNDLADLKLVKNTFGGTVNDVVLTVVAGGLRTWLRSRGVRTEGLELRALVPVSVRAKDQHHELGNRIVVMRGPLPVYVEDPVARLRVVRQAMDGLKDSKQAVGAEVITGLEALAPPTILAQASRLQFSTRLFNLLVTNVPGRSSRCTCSAASSRTCSRSRSCPRTSRWRSRSCPTTAGWTSACSATTTRSRTSRTSAGAQGLAAGAGRRRGRRQTAAAPEGSGTAQARAGLGLERGAADQRRQLEDVLELAVEVRGQRGGDRRDHPGPLGLDRAALAAPRTPSTCGTSAAAV